jgi:hypothetical protein
VAGLRCRAPGHDGLLIRMEHARRFIGRGGVRNSSTKTTSPTAPLHQLPHASWPVARQCVPAMTVY